MGFMILASISCGSPDTPDLLNDSTCARILEQLETHDAIDWLKAPTSSKDTTGGTSTETALALALKFQELGASRLTVHGGGSLKTEREDSSILVESGMVIQLPADPRQRLAIFRLYAKQNRSLGYAANGDQGQKYLFIRLPALKASMIP